MFRSKNPVESYHQPVMTIPDSEIPNYVTAVGEIAEEKLENLPDELYAFQQSYDMLNQTLDVSETYAFERDFYNQLLEGLEDVESKSDLFRHADEAVEAETLLPDYLRPLDIFKARTEGMRGLMLQEVFEEAKEELEG